ncbi:MAG: KpsF/GutQ family sugar-phosphate isomerase, partial [Candidatus Aureabacteria bacterium]|nr:KpsF/GutQ family sugar-phosphate isomerase [Candidatus Auribacterota bacterium]
MTKAKRKVSHRSIAKRVLRIEAVAVKTVLDKLDKQFDRAVDTILHSLGRVIVTGMGKPGLIGRKISATLASLGTPSLFLHPAEAIHGDLGMVLKGDVVIALSNSGESDEIVKLIPIIKKIGASMIAITGNKKSTLARYSDVVLDAGVSREACPMNLAPTASTTAALALGDALAIALLESKNFKIEDYAFFHPGGSLGRKLLKVRDIMRTGKNFAFAKEDESIKAVLIKITRARAGSASIVNSKGKMVGLFTDGDLRKHLEKDPDLITKQVKKYMTRNPTVISQDKLAMEALRIIKDKKFDEIPVIDKKGRPVGLLDEKDLLGLG